MGRKRIFGSWGDGSNDGRSVTKTDGSAVVVVVETVTSVALILNGGFIVEVVLVAVAVGVVKVQLDVLMVMVVAIGEEVLISVTICIVRWSL